MTGLPAIVHVQQVDRRRQRKQRDVHEAKPGLSQLRSAQLTDGQKPSSSVTVMKKAGIPIVYQGQSQTYQEAKNPPRPIKAAPDAPRREFGPFYLVQHLKPAVAGNREANGQERNPAIRGRSWFGRSAPRRGQQENSTARPPRPLPWVTPPTSVPLGANLRPDPISWQPVTNAEQNTGTTFSATLPWQSPA